MSRHVRRTPATAVLITVLLALTAADSLAAKRRAVRPSRPRGSVSGQCHTFGFVTPGLKASYRTTSAGQPDVTFDITYVSDNASQSVVTQKVNVPGVGVADAETTILYEAVAGNLRAVKHIDLTASTSSPIGNVNVDVDMDLVPSLTWGPAAGWCQGATWSIPATVVTTTTKTTVPFVGTTTNTATSSTLAGTGQVLSVDEALTVAGGVFQTVKYRGMNISSACPPGSTGCVSGIVPVNVWLWRDEPIIIRQDTLDAAGNVTSTTQLTSVTGASSVRVRLSE